MEAAWGREGWVVEERQDWKEKREVVGMGNEKTMACESEPKNVKLQRSDVLIRLFVGMEEIGNTLAEIDDVRVKTR